MAFPGFQIEVTHPDFIRTFLAVVFAPRLLRALTLLFVVCSSGMSAPRALIIGGGISGLSLRHYLAKQTPWSFTLVQLPKSPLCLRVGLFGAFSKRC